MTKKLTIQGKIQSEVIELPGGKFGSYDIGSNLIDVLSNPKNPQGATMADMAELLPLIRKLKQAIRDKREYIFITDHEHTILVASLKAFRFSRIDPPVFDWINEIQNLPIQEDKGLAENKHGE